MSSHSEVLSIYKKFASMVHTQFFTPIRVFRADYAGEYIYHSLCAFLAEEGTLAQFSCPGAHAQNGVAERKHRHLLEMTHALMIAASLRLTFGLRLFPLPPISSIFNPLLLCRVVFL
jgi:hypothetical protein